MLRPCDAAQDRRAQREWNFIHKFKTKSVRSFDELRAGSEPVRVNEVFQHSARQFCGFGEGQQFLSGSYFRNARGFYESHNSNISGSTYRLVDGKSGRGGGSRKRREKKDIFWTRSMGSSVP